MRLVLLLATLAVCRLSASPIYQLVDLGTLGGSSTATALNSAGQAVGWSLTPGQSVQATQSGGGGVAQSIDPTHQSRAFGINDSGQTVGIRFDTDGHAEAVMWMADGTAIVMGGADSYAMGVNAAGTAVGSDSGHAVRFTSGGPVSVGVNAPWSSASAINSGGGVAGTAQLASGAFRAFTASGDDTVSMLGTLGGMSSYGQAINSTGAVAGGSNTAIGYLHAFLYASGQMKDLGTLSGTGNSSAYGVNDFGQVVGYSQITGGDSSAFLWENGQLRDLNDLIAVDTGWRLLEASAINNKGQIVGFGLADGIMRAFRLDPLIAQDDPARDPAEVPEPSSLLMVVIGVAGIGLGLARPNYFN